MKIEKLTKEQEVDFDIFVANAITESNGGDISYNEEIVSSFIDFLYDRKNVPFNVCKSPEDMFRVAATYGSHISIATASIPSRCSGESPS